MTADLVYLGLSMGTFYALMAVGLAGIFGILKVINFAHGEFFMLGAYGYALTALSLGLDPYLALLPAFAVGGILGLLVERLLMRPLYEGQLIGETGAMRDEYSIIITFALSLFLMNLAVQVFGPYPMQGPGLIADERVTFGPITTSGHRLVATGVGVLILLGAVGFLRFSPWGKMIQATAQNRFGAAIAGIDTSRVNLGVFGLSGGLAALSGALLAPIFHADPFVGALPAVKSFVIVVLGGMGSVPGAIAGAYILAFLEQFGAVYISGVYQDAYGFVLLILVLLLRPQGLFGERAREV